MTALSEPKQQNAEPRPLVIRIVPVTPPAPAAAPTEIPPSAAPAVQEKSRPRSRDRHRAAPKPPRSPDPRQESATTPLPDVSSSDVKPAPSNAPPAATAPVAPEAVAPTQAPPAVPARTRASEANYAASNRRPPYPRLSQNYNEEGTVLLRVLVKADGTAGAVEIKKSSGYPLLDKSASTTVKTWRFSPATVNGKPVDEWYEVPIPFKLQDN